MTMQTTGFTINEVSENGAAEVVGLDCAAPLDPETLTRVKAAFARSPILVFRHQQLAPREQTAFARQFGPISSADRAEYAHPDDPDILILSNELGADGKPIGVVDAGDFLHSDSSHLAEPVKITLLYSVKNPHHGGDTDYCNMYRVYDALPAALKARIAGRTAVHHVSKTRNPRTTISPGRPGAKEFYERREVEAADVHQPMVRTHPETGRQALYVSPRFTLTVDDLDPEASEGLLQELFAHMADRRFHYLHHWGEHDLVLWDNRCLTHRATGGYVLPDTRRMHRTTLLGDRPFYRA
jgi:taurine dioxygenase